MKNKIGLLVTGSAILGSLLIGGTAFAAGPGFGNGGTGRAPGVFGTVSAVSGNTLTVASKGFGPNATAATYTVDATNATVTKNGSASTLSNVSVGDSVSVQGTVSGTNVTATAVRDGMMGRGMGQAPGVFGTVASVSGNTLTVTSKMGPGGTAGTTYTVDATNATVTKNGASSSVSNVSTGDTVMVQGTVSGTSVTATSIRDGLPQGQKPQTPVIQGNGQPVIGGNVTAINGSTLTVTNKSNVTYTVDATSATVEKGNAVSSISNVAVGDNVVVQGTVNGNAVTASSVIDSGAAPTANSTTNTSGAHQGGMGGFFSGIGSFFHRLFGFF